MTPQTRAGHRAMHLAMHRAMHLTMHLTMHAGVALLLAALLFPGRLRAQARAVVERAHFDTTCAPCADFYQWVNGGWVARTTLDPSTPWAGVGRELTRRTFGSDMHDLNQHIHVGLKSQGQARWFNSTI